MRATQKDLTVAIALLVCGVASASRAASPETSCPASWTGSGQATYYDAFNEPNACALPISPDQYVVAVAEAAFDGSAVCGRCLRITGPLGTIVARVTDYCVGPGCRELDLSPNAFAAIGNPVDGIIDVGWESVACDTVGPIAFHFHAASGDYYAKIQVRNHRHGVASLALAESGKSFVDLARSSDNAFEYFPGASAIVAPLAFRVTDVHGAVVEENGIAYTPGAVRSGSGQFPFCPEPASLLGGAVGLVALMALRLLRSPN